MLRLLILSLTVLTESPVYGANHKNAGDPDGVPADFICAWRSFALEYATLLRPDFDQSIIFDALMLGSLCNKTKPVPILQAGGETKGESVGVNIQAVYISTSGDDAAPGTQAEPKRTVSAGLSASRLLSGKKVMYIEQGTYYLASTLELTNRDEGLKIVGLGDVWLSGARPLPANLTWIKHDIVPSSTGKLTAVVGMDAQSGCKPNNKTGPRCISLNATDGPGTSLETCTSKCRAMGPFGSPPCRAYTFSNRSGTWSNQCSIWIDPKYNYKPFRVSDNQHISGTWVGAVKGQSVWKTVLKPADGHATGSSPISIPWSVNQLRIQSPGGTWGRATRARHPNGDAETSKFPDGYIGNAAQSEGGGNEHRWLPPLVPHPNVPYIPVAINATTDPRLRDKGGGEQFGTYSGGIGGRCSSFDPPFSYWCSPHPHGGSAFPYFVPSGLVWPNNSLPVGWGSKGHWKGATVQAWHWGHWSSWMFEVDHVMEADRMLSFGKGGFQGARGGNGSGWYIEGVLEFLDSPHEFWFDDVASTLYYLPNATGPNASAAATGLPPPPPSTFRAAAPTLQTLLRVNQTQQQPLRGLSISNVGFRDAAPTYMQPHGVPSGGDWALERQAALFFEGTEGLVVDGCRFERLDGNGVMLSGYNRNASLLRNDLSWSGGTAFAAWGRTDEISDGGVHGYDGTAGNFPRYTRVEGNVMREIGVWEKQSSCWFQAKTAQTTLKGNICFNLARAGFNFVSFSHLLFYFLGSHLFIIFSHARYRRAHPSNHQSTHAHMHTQKHAYIHAAHTNTHTHTHTHTGIFRF